VSSVGQVKYHCQDAAVLHAEHLAKAFGRCKVLRDVSFALVPGTLVGIVGEKEAGKSTLLRILAGELRPRRGRVVLRGVLDYCPQAVVLNDVLSVDQHLDYFRAAYGIPRLDRAVALVERRWDSVPTAPRQSGRSAAARSRT
jgi:ABC-type multidrug transport system ATPase subunit